MAVPSYLTDLSSFSTTNVSIETTNLTLARFSELGKESLEKLLKVYNTNLENAVQARLFSNSITIYSLGLTLFAAFIAFTSPRADVKKVATVITFAAALTAAFASFTSLVYYFQIRDYNFWKNVCIQFIEFTPKIN